MDPNNLVELQQSAKPIRNPFGFDFTVKWDKKPITLSGDGEWYPVIAPLAAFIARRLYMKIRYQFHDEQVAAIRAKGDFQRARTYNVPIDVENKIWMLITGEPLHKNLPTADNVDNEADLTVLKNEMKKLEKKGLGGGGAINVSKILEKANVEALPIASSVDGKGEGGHIAGSSKLNGETDNTPPPDTTPVNVAQIQPKTSAFSPRKAPGSIKNLAQATPDAPSQAPAAPINNEPATGEFRELNELA